MEPIGAYILTDRKTRKFYVGSSQDVPKRLEQHIALLNKGQHHNLNLQALWSDDSGLIETVFPTETREEAYLLEQDMLDRFADNPLLLNIGKQAFGGDNLTRHPKREAILVKIKANLKDYLVKLTPLERHLLHSQPGEKNGMWGKAHTVETRAKLSVMKRGVPLLKSRGRKFSTEHRAQISEHAKQRIGGKNPFFGKQHSETTRQLLSEKGKARQVKAANARQVEIAGVVYESLMAAARTLGVSQALIIHRIKNKSGKYPGYRYLPKSPTTIASSE